MKKVTHLKIAILVLVFMAFKNGFSQQTMTFDSGATETGFTFNGWNAAGGTIYFANTNTGASMFKDTGTFNLISFDVGPYTSNTNITVTSDLGHSYSYNTSIAQTHTLNWSGISSLNFSTNTFTAGEGSPDHDNFVYTLPQTQNNVTNGALESTSTNDWLNFWSNLPTTNGSISDFTIQAWVYPTSLGTSTGSNTVVSRLNGGAGVSFDVRMGQPGIEFNIFGSDNNWYAATYSATINTNQWYHITAGYSYTSNKIYIKVYDGTNTHYIETSLGSVTMQGQGANTLVIGEIANPAWRPRNFVGKIDEVKIYKNYYSQNHNITSSNRDATIVDGSPMLSNMSHYFPFNNTNTFKDHVNPGLVINTNSNSNLVSGGKVFPNTNVPDDNFEQELINLGYDFALDDYVPTANIENVTTLNVNSKNISDLTGIEDFTALEELYCGQNNLTSLNVSNNTAITSLGVSDNALTTLDVSSNTNLQSLSCNSNQLTSIDVSSNTALTSLSCANMQLTSIDVSSNTALEVLNCATNQITTLDLSSNTALNNFIGASNNLTSLNIANGNNINFTVFNAINNPNLTCIQVDGETYSTNNWTNIDNTASFSEDCSTFGLTHVPDDNFEQALIDLGYDTAPLDDYVPTANIENVTTLIVSNKNISDLTGIEDFTALTYLNCSQNQLTTLDFSSNTNLATLIASENQLTTLDVSSNTNLTFINVDNNNISTIDLSNNTALTHLFCNQNNLTTLDISSSPNFENLECKNNVSLSSLNVANGNNSNITNPNFFVTVGNPNLECIQVDDATYSTTNWTLIDNHTSFSENCHFNDTYVPDDNFEQALIDLNYDTAPLDDYVSTATIEYVFNLDLSYKNIADLTGIEDFTNLSTLNVTTNNLTTLNVANNANLVSLNCTNNQLTALDVSNNTALFGLECSNNQLTTLDVSSNTALSTINFANNQISSLDVSSNSDLVYVICKNNILTSLNVANGNNTNFTAFNSQDNPNLTCIQVDDATYSTNNWTAIDSTASFSEDCTPAPTTHVPDDNFEQALIDLGYDTAPLDDYVPTANIENVTTLLIPNKNIADLTGIEDFIALEVLNCAQNNLTSLDVSSNSALTELYCYENQLTAIDVSNNTALTAINCANNQLTSLNVANGNNINISGNNFYATNNPNLTCIEVDSETYSTQQWTDIDSTASFSEDCSTFGLTYVPDDNFEQALIDLGYDTAPLDDYVSTANIESVTSLDLGGIGISSLVGIEDFTALTELHCNQNNLNTLDISSNTALTTLNVESNQLTSLDVSNNTNLLILNVGINQLTTLDVSNNTALTALTCYNNQLSEIDVSNNTALTSLAVDNNNLTTLDISANTSINKIWVYNNQLTSLNVANGNNANISSNNFYATGNPNLACIQVDNAANSTNFWVNIDNTSSFSEDCSTFGLTNVPDDNFEQALINLGYDTAPLDDYVPTENIENVNNLNLAGSQIEDFTGLEAFEALTTFIMFANNAATQIDFSANFNLTSITCAQNPNITIVDASNLPNLSTLNLNQNNIDNLIIDYSNAITSLFLDQSQLTSIDVSNLSQLVEFSCSYSPYLTSLNVANGNNTNVTYFQATNLPNVSCIQVDNATYSTTNWTDIDSATSFSEDCSTFGLTYVPDDNFEQALIDLGYDTAPLDDYVPTANIETVTNLNVNNNNIADLTGIEDFTALTTLYCDNNQLTTLDLSNNNALEKLFCSSNQLTSLNVANGNNTNISIPFYFNTTNNPNLACIQVDDAEYSTNTWTNIDSTTGFSEDCSTFGLTYVPDDNFEQALIDLGYDTAPLDDYVPTENIESVTNLVVELSNISSLEGIEDFTALTSLSCSGNQLTSLDVSNNTALTSLYCGDNQLTTLDVSNNTNLIVLSCTGNQLTTLDLSNNTALVDLYCNYNQLTSLILDNGSNSDLVNLYTTGNPNLTCIQVDDVDYSTTNWTNIDSTSSFSEDCSTFGLTYVPDDNFEQALINLGYDTAPLDDYVPTANIENVTNLDLTSKNITDLTGVEDFTALTELIVKYNQLTTINVSNNTALSNLDCSSNQLTSLDISNNTALITLDCTTNSISNLDVSSNTALTAFYCANNALSNLDVSNNMALTQLSCGINFLSTLDVSNNTALIRLLCQYSSNLSSLNVANGNNTNFTSFYATDNPNLTCIQVDDADYSTTNWTNIDSTASFSEDCSTFGLTNVPDDNFEQALIDLGYDTAPLDDYVPTANIESVTFLDVGNKNIADLTGIEDFVALTELRCNNNQLTTLDVSNNTALTKLNCTYNQLTTIDVSNNTALTSLGVSNNQLTSLDVSNNTALTTLVCGSNQLTTLDVSNNTLLNRLYCSVNQLASLNIANGNNSNIPGYEFVASSNPDLTCIQVSDLNYCTNNWYLYDSQIASFSLNCNISLATEISNANPVVAGTGLLGETITVSLDTDADGMDDVTYSTTVDADGNWEVDTATATPESGSLGTLEDGGVVAVTVSDTAGNEATGSFTVDNTLNVEEEYIKSIKLFPNPASNYIQLRGLKKEATYAIYTILGVKIAEGKINNKESIAVDDLSNGVYLFILNNKKTIRFIKKE